MILIIQINYYNTPAILRHENYDNKVDLFSIGIIIYQLFFNNHPFGDTLTQMNDKINN